MIGQGAGWYITGGKAIPIMWAKASETGITHYYDLSGAEITLNPGKTYIGICPSDDWTSEQFPEYKQQNTRFTEG